MPILTVLAIVGFVVLQIILMCWAIGDLAKRPVEAWESAGLSQIRWATIVFLAFVIGPLAYLFSVRPKLEATVATS